MSKRRVYEITGNRGDWTVKERGAGRAVGNFDTKEEAVDRGREVARNVPGPSQLLIKDDKGRIQTEHTYRDDPYPPKG